MILLTFLLLISLTFSVAFLHGQLTFPHTKYGRSIRNFHKDMVASDVTFPHTKYGRSIRNFHKYMVASDVTFDDQSLLPLPKPKIPRKSALWEKGAIFVLSYLLSSISPNKKDCMKFVYIGMDYDGFVMVTKKMLQGSLSVESLRSNIVNLLKTLLPPKVRSFFQNTYAENPRSICEMSSQWMSFGFLEWLVGKTERLPVEVEKDGVSVQWMSGVKLVECRYLVDSGCKATCLHLCKGPTQEFFNKELGLPLHMKPNFEDCSCEMLFGIPPPSPEKDEAYGEPCFSTCSMRKENRQWRMEAKPEERAGATSICSKM